MVVVFMGSPDFAVPSLEAVLSAGHVVPCVFTQPDKPRARGRHPLPTPVKAFAESRGVWVFSPKTLRGEAALQTLREAAPDAIVVVAYGLLLPPEVLGLPRHGCINVHASLLPKYRGAAPIERAIMAGERVTGVSTMYMAEGWDTGDIILQEAVPIGEDMTAGELRETLAAMGADLLRQTLELMETQAAPRVPQDESAATYAPRIRPGEFVIDWALPAKVVHNLVRAASPKPGAVTRASGKLLKVFRGRPAGRPAGALSPEPVVDSAPPGAVLGIAPGGELAVKTGEGVYLVSEVQAEGGRRMSASRYLRGRPMQPGTVLG